MTIAQDMIEYRGIRFPYVPEIITERVKASLLGNRYEQKEATQVEKLVMEGDRILELGAGLGFISTLCARNPKTASVRCYEADPRLIEYIRKLHELNGVTSVDVRHAILGNDPTKTEATFYIRENFWGSSMSASASPSMSSVVVPVESFNAMMESYRPTFIICDIEGAELDLFLNASLHGVTRVLMEIHSRVLGRAGVKRLFDAMSARDFHYDEFHSNGSVVLFSHVRR